MAFGNYLIKVGDYIIPYHYISFETYEVTPDQRQDVESYRDLNQDLHRNVSDHYKTVVSFTTLKNLKEPYFRELLDGIQDNFINTKERKVHVSYWNAETGTYGSGDFYWVQPKIKIRKIDALTNTPIYDELEIKFIEY